VQAVPTILTTGLIYAGAALAEIGGCFAFWAWLRQGQSPIWLVAGIPSLIAFAWLLTLAPTEHAGRAYAAYGGVYIVASLLWLWLAEGTTPDRWDAVGGGLALVAVAIILFAPRG
jgi:small multidrug resistance family-3 protein